MTGKYYIVVQEWNYPTDSGRDIMNGDDFDTAEEADNYAFVLVSKEVPNFRKAVKCKDYHSLVIKGIGLYGGHEVRILGEDEFYYAARVVEIEKLRKVV